MIDKTQGYWLAKSKSLKIRSEAFIDGKWVNAGSGRTFDAINPATNTVITRVAACEIKDVDLAVSAARKAFNSGVWSNAAPEKRKAVLLRLAELIRANAEDLGLLDTLEMGKPISYSTEVDVPLTANTFQWFGEAIDKVYGEIAPTPKGDLALVRREPLGVIGCVVPWNYPLLMAAWKLAPALAVGNSVVLKPAEQSSLSALRLAELAVEAGLPAGVLNVVPGYGENAGQALGRHMDVDCIAFTGSTEIGKVFLRYSADSNMKQVWLECGGKSPNIVFADCEDIESAADAAAFGIWYDQGEVCSANSRLIVEQSIKERFVKLLTERARNFQPGDPLDPSTKMGAIVDEAQTERIMRYVGIGKDIATLRVGGERATINGSSNFVTPTIFDDVTNDMAIAREEIFGPVLSVISFRDEEEALSIANDSIFGLAGSVWSSNLGRVHRIAERLRVGTVSVNCVDAAGSVVPFGGFKQSGIGRDNSLHALDKYSNLKTIWIKY